MSAGSLGQMAALLALEQNLVLLRERFEESSLFSSMSLKTLCPLLPLPPPVHYTSTALWNALGTELAETCSGILNRSSVWSCSEQIKLAVVKTPGVKSQPCHIDGSHVQKLTGDLHKKRITHTRGLGVYREIGKFISAYSPYIAGLCPKPWTNNIQKNIRRLRHSGQQASLQQNRRTEGKIDNWDPAKTQLSASHYLF